MQSHLQPAEIEAVRRRHDDLAIHDGADRQLREKDVVQLGEVAIERPQIGALDVDVILARAAKHDRAKPVPFWLEQKIAVYRDGFSEFGEHRIDRGRDGQRVSARHAISKTTTRQVDRTGPPSTYWGYQTTMRIAQVAPLYESVPPKYYGGTERVVSYLTEELVRQGHEVTLYASGDSVTGATLVPASVRSLRLDADCRDPIAHHVRELELVARGA